jgi:hypothetical protein
MAPLVNEPGSPRHGAGDMGTVCARGVKCGPLRGLHLRQGRYSKYRRLPAQPIHVTLTLSPADTRPAIG